MIFRLTHAADVDFEIPDDWLSEAGATTFRATVDGYPASAYESCPQCPVIVVSLEQIAPFRREIGFVRPRMISVLRGLVSGGMLPAIAVHEPPLPSTHQYALRDGYHRFYACAALRFRSIPVAVLDYFDFDAWGSEDGAG